VVKREGSRLKKLEGRESCGSLVFMPKTPFVLAVDENRILTSLRCLFATSILR
jgi:hypothetical protein